MADLNKNQEKISPEASEGTGAEQKTKNLKNVEQIKPLRTYEDDVKNTISGDNISTAKILLAEQKRREDTEIKKQKTSVENPKNKFFIFITIFLIIAGTGSVAYAFISGIFHLPKPQPKEEIIHKTFIDTDSQSEIIVENRNIRDVFKDIKEKINTTLPPKEIQEIFLTKTEIKVMDGENIRNKIPITAENFFELLESRAPDSLIRALDSKFMFGLHSVQVNEPFIIFRVNDFNNAFAGMLEWEDLMVRDIKSIFYNNLAIPEPQPTPVNNSQDTATTSSDVASTTPEIASTTSELINEEDTPILDYDPRGFEDIVLSNRDARAIKNTEGEILYFYSFIDKNTLILTSSKATLDELLKRLRSASLIRG